LLRRRGPFWFYAFNLADDRDLRDLMLSERKAPPGKLLPKARGPLCGALLEV
jgi:hypothetical protein